MAQPSDLDPPKVSAAFECGENTLLSEKAFEQAKHKDIVIIFIFGLFS